MNALHVAACQGFDEHILAVLASGSVHVDHRNSEGWTPLMFGACNGHARVVKVLLSKGADVSMANKDGLTPLHLSIRGGYLPVTKLLVNAGADVTARDHQNLAPLHLAAQHGRTDVTTLLIKLGVDLEMTDCKGQTALHLAAEAGHWEANQALLNGGADINATNSLCATPLHMAAECGRSAIATMLIRAGAERARSSEGGTLLHTAAEAAGGRLMTPGDPNLRVKNSLGATPLHVAAEHGHSAVSALLVKAGAALEEETRKGQTALHLASQGGHTEVASFLVKAGSDLEATTSAGYSPLLLAAQNGHSEVLMALVKDGADVEAETPQGLTPLHLAAQNGHSTVMTTLIYACGVNLNACVPDGGETPLYLAARNGHAGAVRVLLSARANALMASTGESGSERVPLDAAAGCGRLEVVRELIHHRGIEGCGGKSEGEQALSLAARSGHVDIMNVLADAGVIDMGSALISAAEFGGGLPVKFLLQQQQQQQRRRQEQQEQQWRNVGERAYVNTADSQGRTPLICSIHSRSGSTKVVRLLVDAGAHTTSTVRLTSTPGGGEVEFDGTPLAYTNGIIRRERVWGNFGTEDKGRLDDLEGIRRLLLRVEAVHATSWSWPGDVPPAVLTALAEKRSKTRITSKTLRASLPVLRRRARARGVVVAPLLRFSSKAAGDGGDEGVWPILLLSLVMGIVVLMWTPDPIMTLVSALASAALLLVLAGLIDGVCSSVR